MNLPFVATLVNAIKIFQDAKDKFPRFLHQTLDLTLKYSGSCSIVNIRDLFTFFCWIIIETCENVSLDGVLKLQLSSRSQIFFKICFSKLHNIYWKATVLESLFNKVAGLQAWLKRDSRTGVFLWILWNF